MFDGFIELSREEAHSLFRKMDVNQRLHILLKQRQYCSKNPEKGMQMHMRQIEKGTVFVWEEALEFLNKEK